MTHTLTTNARLGYLNAASITDNTFITDLLVLTAMTLPVFARSEELFAEKTIFFRLECSIIDRLRLLYFAA